MRRYQLDLLIEFLLDHTGIQIGTYFKWRLEKASIQKLDGLD
jgi:hypothetical protein